MLISVPVLRASGARSSVDAERILIGIDLFQAATVEPFPLSGLACVYLAVPLVSTFSHCDGHPRGHSVCRLVHPGTLALLRSDFQYVSQISTCVWLIQISDSSVENWKLIINCRDLEMLR